MKYNIVKDCSKSAYMQLYELLRKDIVQGIYPYGSKLPSKRLIAEETGISVITVEHAYSILCDEGYVEAHQRSGYFVIYRENDFFSHSETASENTNKYPSRNLSDSTFPYSVLAKTMRKVLIDYGDSILVKSPNQGCIILREALCEYLARSNGMLIRPEQVVIGSGAEYLYSLIVQLFGNDKIFAIENPSYEKIRQVYTANGAVCDILNLGRNGIKTSELKKTTANILHVTPFNSFPSGITANASKRAEYLRWSEERNGYIIEDNYESELTVSKKNEDTIFSLSENDNVIYLNTFSKTIAPSMRVGYMVLPEKLLNTFKEKLGFYSCTVPVFEQYVLTELLNSGIFERHINRVRRTRRKEKLTD